jgi:hypothetical protein
MTAPQSPTASGDDLLTAPADVTESCRDELAVSPAIGPLPPIHVARGRDADGCHRYPNTAGE